MRLGAHWLKSLIFQRFGSHPEFLWITLLTSRRDTLASLENQGSGWNARKKSKTQILYKSTTWQCYCFGSKEGKAPDDLAQCSTRFVHKSGLIYRFRA
jgi:hypothetical protein